MLDFLRIFHQFRTLEAQAEESATALIRAEDETRFWRARAEDAELARNKATQECQQALKQVANHLAINSGCVMVPFPEVYTPPRQPEQTEAQTAPQWKLAREVQRESVARSRRGVVEQMRKAQADIE